MSLSFDEDDDFCKVNDDDYWSSSTKKGFDFDDDSGNIEFFTNPKVTTTTGNSTTSALYTPGALKSTTGHVITCNLSLLSFIEEGEIQKNKKQVIGTEKETPKITIRNLILGVPYTLEKHKSKQAKLELLDEAIRWHDGDAIIVSVLFLKQTLKAAIFNSEMIMRPRAVNHYLKYLKLHKQYTALGGILGMLGRTEEVALAMYVPASASPHPQTKINHLETLQRNYLKNDSSLNFIGGLVQEHILILQKQIVIDADDSKAEIEGKNFLFRDYPRPNPVANTPVITTLYYCCFYHYNLAQNILSSPLYIRAQHSLTEKQFLWTALKALASLKLWTDIEKLFQTKSWIGGKKMKSCVGFERVVYILKDYQAPKEVITTYLNLIDDTEARLEVAKGCQYYRVAVDILVLMRDRVALVDYKMELQQQQNKDYLYAEESLRASSIKWKN